MKDFIFYHLDPWIPRTLARLPYLLSLEALSSFKDIQFWSRNSIFEGNFVFGVSDLDVTAMSEIPLDSKQMNEFYKKYLSVKKVYPWIGEINLYARTDLPTLKDIINPLEANRDKILIQELGGIKDPTTAEKCAFILRMLYSDRKKLKANPELRQKKWQGHFRHLGINHQGFITVNVIKNILVALGDEKIAPVIDVFFDENYDEMLIYHQTTPEAWAYCYPHLYLLSQKMPPQTENSFLKEVAIAQLNWDIVGIYTQKYWLNIEQYKVHVQGLLKFYQYIGAEDDFKVFADKTEKLLSVHIE